MLISEGAIANLEEENPAAAEGIKAVLDAQKGLFQRLALEPVSACRGKELSLAEWSGRWRLSSSQLCKSSTDIRAPRVALSRVPSSSKARWASPPPRVSRAGSKDDEAKCLTYKDLHAGAWGRVS
jgi:hypothetical protein